MSITTKAGDGGWTQLLFQRRVRKDDPRVEAYGTIDELSSFLGLAKSLLKRRAVKALIESVQTDLFIVASEMAVQTRDVKRLQFRCDAAMVQRVEQAAAELEAKLDFKGCCFLIPGNTTTSAALDVCRCVARRAERLAVRLRARRTFANPHVIPYLNRLSDLLYLLARAEEQRHTLFHAPKRQEKK